MGNGYWVVVMDSLSVQPFASVTVTVKVPLSVTVIVALVEPVDHKYPVPPEAVRSTEPPAQKLVGPFGVIDAVGNGLTVTVTALDVAGLPVAQPELEVSSQVTASPSASVELDQESAVAPPTIIPFTNH